MDRITKSAISKLVVTNTIPQDDRVLPIKDRIVELCVGPLLGEAIRRIHLNESISALFHKTAGTKR